MKLKHTVLPRFLKYVTIDTESDPKSTTVPSSENQKKTRPTASRRVTKDQLSPETTEGKDGFIHPVTMEGNAEQASIQFIIRDFKDEKLNEHEAILEKIMNQVLKNYPNSVAKFEVKEQYRNMKKILDQYPHVVAHALEAIQRAGMSPKLRSIRGGTDGSRLSFMGLPCPNIFTGGHAFHSPQEWVSRQDMEKAVEVLIALVQVWEETAD